MRDRTFLAFFLICALASSSAFLYLYFRVPPGLKLDTLQLFDSSGSLIKASDLERNKGLVLHFFATWCPDCRKEMPNLIEASNEINKSGYQIYLISDEPFAVAANYLNKFQLNDVKLMQSQAKFKEIGINAIPTTYIFSENNKEQFSKTGAVAWESSSFITKHFP